MIKLSFSLALGIGTFIFAVLFAFSELWPFTFIIAILSFLWWLASENRKLGAGVAHAGLFIYSALGVAGVLSNIADLWLYIALIIIFIAWDLSLFIQRVLHADKIGDKYGLLIAHLERLFVLAAIALAAGSIGFSFKIFIGFWLLIPIAILGIYGITRALRVLQRESD